MPRFWKKGERPGQPLRIFYASDFHGSDTTFRKFVNAGKFYQADVLICGGDLMGKTVVPVVADGRGSRYAYLHGQRQEFTSREEIANFKMALGKTGAYTVDCEQDEYESLSKDKDEVEKLFNKLATERLGVMDWLRPGAPGRHQYTVLPRRGQRRHRGVPGAAQGHARRQPGLLRVRSSPAR